MFFSKNALKRAKTVCGGEVAVSGFSADASNSMRDNNFIERSQSRLMQSLLSQLRQAGIRQEQAVRIGITLSVLVLANVILAIISGKIYLVALAVLISFFSWIFLQQKIAARAKAFEKDYAAMLISLASSIRTGVDPLVALMHSKCLFNSESEIYKALHAFCERIDEGYPEEKAIREFASDVRHPDIELFRAAFILARREGSSLALCLHRLASVTRQRQSFRRKVRSAVAMQKLSAWGIAGCAIVISLIQYITNPKAIGLALEHPVGVKILAAGGLLIVIGLLWMLNLAKSRV